MSASAEVYIIVNGTRSVSPTFYPEIVDEWLAKVGLPTGGVDYKKWSGQSGDTYEVRGHSVSYDVFNQDWSASLVQEFYAKDKSLGVDVYVYTLDREPDAEFSTEKLIMAYEEAHAETLAAMDAGSDKAEGDELRHND